MTGQTTGKEIRNKRKHLREVRASMNLFTRAVVTGRMAKEIAEDRQSGMTYADIAMKHCVSLATAMRYGNPKSKENQDARYRAKYLRNKDDPVYQAKVREAVRRYEKREREKNAKAKNTDV